VSINLTSASAARLPVCPRFVLVNDRFPGADTYCVLCCEKIQQGYVREPQTRLLYCDTQCFSGHEKMATLAVKRRTRQVS
jgi:hypothetical protein